MNWLLQMHAAQPVAHAIGVLALVCVAGMAVGSLKVRGVGLGTAGVLFAGILTGYFGKPVDHATLEFVKEFGLILFVFTIGLQLGPGFLAALRQQGLALNALAATVVVLGVLMASALGWLLGIDPAAVLGLLSGATTNTPSLGAAQQTLTTLFSPVGALWLFAGVFVTVPPILVVGVFARAVLKMNFVALSGLLAGSMTDPPALAFASNISGSDAPTVSYATVYPLTMVLRILSMQILALLLCG